MKQVQPLKRHKAHRFFTSLLTGLTLLVIPAVLADPCDPRVPRRCNDQPPSGLCGNAGGRACTWRSDGTVRWDVGVLCRFNVPGCPSVPPNECNYRVRAFQVCAKYTCRNSAGDACGTDSPKFVYVTTEYLPLGEDCQGNPCGPSPSPVPVPIPGHPVIPTKR